MNLLNDEKGLKETGIRDKGQGRRHKAEGIRERWQKIKAHLRHR